MPFKSSKQRIFFFLSDSEPPASIILYMGGGSEVVYNWGNLASFHATSAKPGSEVKVLAHLKFNFPN